MSTIAIVGGHGQIALHLIEQLRARDHDVVALIRNDAHTSDVEQRGATARRLDIEQQDADAFASVFDGCDAVVFAAGGGPDGNISRKRAVDLEGSLKSIEGARIAGVRRFVQVSAIGVDLPLPEDTDDVWRAYVEAKRDADVALRESGLDWTIIRPGRLTDDPAVIAEVLHTGAGIGRQWDLVTGETPLDEAVASA
jgi:nucleoside-diphosphate-sugar epimerase